VFLERTIARLHLQAAPTGSFPTFHVPGLTGRLTSIEHQFAMAAAPTPRLVHRTAHLRLRATRHQADRCYRLLRAAGDLWAWLLDDNRTRLKHDQPPISNYQALCRQLTSKASFGELSTVGARSVLRRYADAWHQAANRGRQGQQAGFPRRKRALVPVRYYHGTFQLDRRRVRLPVAKGCPELWVRLARPIPYPPQQVRAVTLLHDGGRLWLAITAAMPVEQHDLDPGRVAGVDLGIIHPYAVITQDAGLLVSGRALRAEGWLHLHDQQARRARAARRAPRPGQRGSRRWRRHRARLRRVEARHRRRVHQAQHQAARQVIAFAVRQRVGTLLVGDPKGITGRDVGRAHNLRLRQWRRTHLLGALKDKAERAGIVVRLVDERGSSSTCPACRRRVPKPAGRRFGCPHCGLQGIGIWWVPTTSPPSMAADIPARTLRCWWSTVGPASCRRGVTGAATSTTSGGVGLARPRATRQRQRSLLGVARHLQGRLLRLARIRQHCQPGKRCLKGHQ
jgi:IS605 OrfB family transposase